MICTEGQGFGQNYNPSYQAGGLLGHTGQDWSCGFGTPIYSQYDGFVYKVLTKENPANDGSGFTGVFMIVDDGKECFEWLVGHCDPTVSVGTQVKKGDQIGTEANHGTVYSGNIQITLAMQASGDQRGCHRHYQKRPIKKSLSLDFQPALSSTDDLPGIYRDPQGYYYPIWNYSNGFHGCVSPSIPVFSRNLFFGLNGYDVYVLQRILSVLGYLKVNPTGYYGTNTISAVTAYQKASGINPFVGYFGTKTRASISHYLSTSPVLSGE